MKDYQDIHRFKMQPERKARPNTPAKIFYGILKPTTGRYAQKLKFVSSNYFAKVPKNTHI
jgi:hypothetical protein